MASDTAVVAMSSNGHVIGSASELRMILETDPEKVTFIDSDGKGEFTGDKIPSSGTLSVRTKTGGNVAKVSRSGKNITVS